MARTRRTLRLFRAGGGRIVQLHPRGGRKVAGSEDEIHRLIEDNLPDFFPGLEKVARKPILNSTNNLS